MFCFLARLHFCETQGSCKATVLHTKSFSSSTCHLNGLYQLQLHHRHSRTAGSSHFRHRNCAFWFNCWSRAFAEVSYFYRQLLEIITKSPGDISMTFNTPKSKRSTRSRVSFDVGGWQNAYWHCPHDHKAALQQRRPHLVFNFVVRWRRRGAASISHDGADGGALEGRGWNRKENKEGEGKKGGWEGEGRERRGIKGKGRRRGMKEGGG